LTLLNQASGVTNRMSETLTIKNFGPIKEMSFEFTEINILIGEQSTGKSTVAKLLSAINSMASGDSSNLGGIGLNRKESYGKIEHFNSHIKVYSIENYFKKNTFIQYKSKNFEFSYEEESCYLNLFNSNTIDSLFDKLNVTYIPADRAAVNLFTNEILFTLNEIKSDLPGYFIRFARLYNRLKKSKDSYSFLETIGVKYKYADEKDKITLKNGNEIDIKEVSSAIQTNLSFLIILAHQAGTNTESKNSALNLTVIEEPELNCFPNLQHDILKYIVVNLRNIDTSFFRRTLITTHSPYILTSLNNLMYAYDIGQKEPEEVNKIIEKKYWVNPTDVRAYRLLPDGTCEDIISNDENGRLIRAEKIDGISGFLNEQFDKLLNLEFVQK
jgi:predicted ATPase